ncbi:DUF5712 family protein [Bacteroides stercoris]|uniref:Clindamycin resistance transfer factor BtgB n=1 Tax=Bacteroides stercoris ATCC 43183 TaxID=449673 RepID=B0NWA0_BACSE|nr:DUF5712 family protein [Bacteroides stercoris]EDS13602.1 hypothetical protein BACSTE_03783 [Bacteroides stercoris ATCC 43183]UWO04968.1 DUF5712 family protein [Bacteroides stercoris ATCC 43183]SDX61762.1 hypothetical protein SAMN05444283_1508 [Bacteroides stercoris]
MHIDFAPPSGGTYNNAGSSRQLALYMEHEDMERMQQGIYTDGFFNLTDDNIYKSKVIKDIDTNIGQLLKTDAKFFAIHVSPSENELRSMGNTEQEQAEAMKRYIREVFIPEYAKNFNKGLSEEDVKFYGKIHFSRSRSNNELNMHCHLIVSRKDQANKKKLSPLTNHKDTKKGTVTGGFDRVNLFQQTEQGFDKLFGYNRQLSESFDYHNTMKNGSISEQLELQEQNFTGEKKKEVFQSSEKENIISCNLDSKAENKQSYNQQNNSGGDSILSIFSLGDGNNYDATLAEELQAQKRKKKKKKGIKR